LDDNSYGTPPTSKDVTSHNRLVANQGFISPRLVNARGEGQNSITYNPKLTPVKPGTPTQQTGDVSATQGGQAGWGPYLAWSASLPGGEWDYTVTVTAPSNITGSAYVVPSGTQAFTLLAPNPAIKVFMLGVPANDADHFYAGLGLNIVWTLDDTSVHQLIQPSSPGLGLRRFNSATQVFEYLRPSDLTWQPATGTLTVFTTATSPAIIATSDNLGWQLQFTGAQTAGWSTTEMELVAIGFDSSGTPYVDVLQLTNVGGSNKHSGNQFDGVAFATGGGVVSYE
ncbi:MAG: hypothetical protein ACYC7B_14990, partial [Burkholderiales bacterium]